MDSPIDYLLISDDDDEDINTDYILGSSQSPGMLFTYVIIFVIKYYFTFFNCRKYMFITVYSSS